MSWLAFCSRKPCTKWSTSAAVQPCGWYDPWTMVIFTKRLLDNRIEKRHSNRLKSSKSEEVGFEPTVRFWRTHAFQACSFGRSDTPPKEISKIPRARTLGKRNRKEWDSNPRYQWRYASLAGTCFRPLSHLSNKNKFVVNVNNWELFQQGFLADCQFEQSYFLATTFPLQVFS